MNPKVFSCGYSGIIFGIISMKTMIYLVIGAALLYYFWAYAEALIIALPIPDPKEIKDRVSKMV